MFRENLFKKRSNKKKSFAFYITHHCRCTRRSKIRSSDLKAAMTAPQEPTTMPDFPRGPDSEGTRHTCPPRGRSVGNRGAVPGSGEEHQSWRKATGWRSLTVRTVGTKQLRRGSALAGSGQVRWGTQAPLRLSARAVMISLQTPVAAYIPVKEGS